LDVARWRRRPACRCPYLRDDRVRERRPYVLPHSGLVINLPTKHDDYGFRVESVGFPIDVSLEDDVRGPDVAAIFDALA